MEFPFLERRMFYFHVLCTEFWAVCLEHHCSFWEQNLHFLSIEFSLFRVEFAFSELRILGSLLEHFWVQNLYFLYLYRISIFEHRILFFLPWNLHFLTAECQFLERRILESLTSLEFAVPYCSPQLPGLLDSTCFSKISLQRNFNSDIFWKVAVELISLVVILQQCDNSALHGKAWKRLCSDKILIQWHKF